VEGVTLTGFSLPCCCPQLHESMNRSRRSVDRVAGNQPAGGARAGNARRSRRELPSQMSGLSGIGHRPSIKFLYDTGPAGESRAIAPPPRERPPRPFRGGRGNLPERHTAARTGHSTPAALQTSRTAENRHHPSGLRRKSRRLVWLGCACPGRRVDGSATHPADPTCVTHAATRTVVVENNPSLGL